MCNTLVGQLTLIDSRLSGARKQLRNAMHHSSIDDHPTVIYYRRTHAYTARGADQKVSYTSSEAVTLERVDLAHFEDDLAVRIRRAKDPEPAAEAAPALSYRPVSRHEVSPVLYLQVAATAATRVSHHNCVSPAAIRVSSL